VAVAQVNVPCLTFSYGMVSNSTEKENLMHVSLEKDTLARALKKVSGAIAARHGLPALRCVLVDVDDSGAAFTATDLEVQMRVRLTAIGTEPGKMLVSGAKLVNIVNSLNNGAVDLSGDVENGLTIKCGKAAFTLVALDAADFPMLEFGDAAGGVTCGISAANLSSGLRQLSFALSTDNSRPVLTGMNVRLQNGLLQCVATDGRRLALGQIETAGEGSGEGACILPSKAVALAEHWENASSTIRMRWNERMAEFDDGSFRCTTKLIEGLFPDFTKVVPEAGKYPVVFKRDEIINALRRAALVVDGNVGVSLNITKDHGQLHCTSAEVGKAEDSVSAIYSGNDTTITFNPDFLIEPLSRLKSETVQLSRNSDSAPVLVTVPGETSFTYVMMPMRC